MNKGNEIVACLVMEQTTEPQTPEIMQVINQPGTDYVRFRTCLQNFNTFNRNNRNYFREPMVKAWEAEHIQELLRYGTFFGENGHPNTKDPQRVVSIDPNNLSHRIVSYEFVGDTVFGIIDTANDYNGPGHQFKGHILQGAKAAFSLRALAPITKIDATRGEIRSTPRIITYDRVILPSHKVAYQTDDPITAIHESTGVAAIATEQVGDICIPVSECLGLPGLSDFLLEESNMAKNIADMFEINYESATLDSTGKNLVLQESTVDGTRRTFTVGLEDYVQEQVSDILRNM